MHRHFARLILGPMILALAACANATPDDPFWTDIPASQPPAKTPAPTKAPTAEEPVLRPSTTPEVFEYGLMTVDELDVRLLGPAPAEVSVRVMGVLGDACTEFDGVEQTRDGDTVILTLSTRRPADLICAQVARIYERTLTLDGTFEVGNYRIVANGVETTFDIPAPGGSGEWIEGLAFVDDVQVAILESFPVQVSLTVSGWLPDGCTEIDAVTQSRDGNTVIVTLTTRRPADALCTQALVDFTQSVKLDGPFPPGNYLIRVNDLEVPLHVD